MSDRSIRWLAVCAVFLVGPAVADPPGARATLSLHDGKAAYLSGEAIVVDLVIDASEPADIDRSTDTSQMDIDQIEVTPVTGVYPWRADSERFTPRWGDSFTRYPPSRQFRTTLTLNRRFRFDGEGNYRIHVVTRRVKPVLATNDVSFTITRASSDEERSRAVELDQSIRHAPDERTAGRLATQIDWLSDDAATDVKLGLLVGPDKSDCYFRHDTTGLWIARDRQRVIDRLEQALVDPAEDIPMGSSLVGTLIALKVSQRVPHERDANEPLAPRRGMGGWTPGALDKETAELGARYMHAIAATLPQRTGRSRIDAAQRVMWSKGRAPSLMDDADFRAARELVIDHFEDVDPYNVDTDLNNYGRFLEDARMIPKLKALLDAPSPGPLSSGRGLALNLLAKLDPSSSADYVAKEACAEQPTTVASLRDLPLVSVPQADDCLATRLDFQASSSAPALQLKLDFATLPYVARFASDRLVTRVAAVYPALLSRPHNPAAVSAALVYLMRWDAQRYRSLLETAADDDRNISLPYQLTALAAAPTDGLRAFMRDRIASTPTPTTQSWIYALGQIGEAEDMRFLQERLDRIRASPSSAIASQVAPLEQAIRRGGRAKSTPS